MRICGIVFGRVAMVVGGVVLASPPRGYAATLSSVMPLGDWPCSIHNNQTRNGCVAKVPATEAKQQATTSQRNKRARGHCNTNISVITAIQLFDATVDGLVVLVMKAMLNG
jgi:hypothetical protein